MRTLIRTALTVLLAALAILAAPTGPAGAGVAPGFVHVHASGHWTATPATVRHRVTTLAAHGADLVTLTEVNAPGKRAAMRIPGWGACRPHGADTGLAWNRTRFARVGACHATVLTADTYWRITGVRVPPLTATWTRLADTATRGVVVVYVVHLPSHVEQRTLPRRNATWNRAAATLAALVNRTSGNAAVLVAGDWNLNWHVARDRRKVTEAMRAAALTPSCLPAPAGGTHAGGRLIDYAFTARLTSGRCRILPRTRYSDHRPIEHLLRERTANPGGR